jgi:hypothetical protein
MDEDAVKRAQRFLGLAPQHEGLKGIELTKNVPPIVRVVQPPEGRRRIRISKFYDHGGPLRPPIVTPGS